MIGVGESFAPDTSGSCYFHREPKEGQQQRLKVTSFIVSWLQIADSFDVNVYPTRH